MTAIDDVRIINFTQRGDERGHLVVIEDEKDIAFTIRRVFYMYGSASDAVRGKHANMMSKFVLINVAGKSKIRVDDGLGHEKVFDLDRPNIGIYLPRLIWKDMYEFSSDSVLLCLSSEHYDAKEYIRNYDEFVEVAKVNSQE